MSKELDAAVEQWVVAKRQQLIYYATGEVATEVRRLERDVERVLFQEMIAINKRVAREGVNPQIGCE